MGGSRLRKWLRRLLRNKTKKPKSESSTARSESGSSEDDEIDDVAPTFLPEENSEFTTKVEAESGIPFEDGIYENATEKIASEMGTINDSDIDSSLGFTSDDSDYIDPDKLTDEVSTRRIEILETLVSLDILTNEEAEAVRAYPRDLAGPNRVFVQLNNLIDLPDHLLLSTCFVDFLNFRCRDATTLRAILLKPVSIAFCERQLFRRVVRPDAVVMEFLDIVDGMFYSFCYGRLVPEDDTQHCGRCHVCKDYKYHHCMYCDQCSIGMTIGKCEHCGFEDLPAMGDGPPPEVGYKSSVESVSDLIDYIPTSSSNSSECRTRAVDHTEIFSQSTRPDPLSSFEKEIVDEIRAIEMK